MDRLERLAQEVGVCLTERAFRLAVAESCTGGWVAMVLTGVAGSSQWFDRGFVTYSNQAKQQMLGVQASTLETYGAVSEQTVAAMTRGALAVSDVDISLSISGIAGPGGGTPEKPVGTVCFAWQFRQQPAVTAWRWFPGDRRAVRRQAAEHALETLLELLENG
ncbi:MAG: CinA family protein [Gammaproteobacteria bacterium]|nr:CinA family protein [Gammaproteobacteria bacterium]